MRVWYEIKMFFRIMKSFKWWYLNSRKQHIVADCLETTEGRKELAKAMCQGIYLNK